MANRKPHPDSIYVEIFGSTYTLRGGSDPATVRSLASELDGRMRELAAPASAADPLKVAVLAALRLADEVRAARGEAPGHDLRLEERIEGLTRRLERAIAPETATGPDPAGPALDGGLPLG